MKPNDSLASIHGAAPHQDVAILWDRTLNWFRANDPVAYLAARALFDSRPAGILRTRIENPLRRAATVRFSPPFRERRIIKGVGRDGVPRYRTLHVGSLTRTCSEIRLLARL